jgi:hypothetical protein
MGDVFWFEQFCFSQELISIYEAYEIFFFAKEHTEHSPREQQLQSRKPLRFIGLAHNLRRLKAALDLKAPLTHP